MTAGSVNPTLSVVCAVIYLIGNAFPIITLWVPPSDKFADTQVEWFVVPVMTWSVLGFASLWFLGFLARAKRREHRRHQEFVVERYPEFEWAAGEERHAGEGDSDSGLRRRAGGLVLVHETVSLLWKGRDMTELGRMTNGADRGGEMHYAAHHNAPPPVFNNNPYAGTDFEELGK
jgi:hypothetical protein